MVKANNGNTVKVHYTGKLDDGTVFDSSRDSDPIEFTLGEGRMIPGFESAVMGMEVGDSKTVRLGSEQAYGPHRDDKMLKVDRREIPESIPLAKGMKLQAQAPNGEVVYFSVVEFNDSQVTLDGNHPMAGKDLTFEIELVSMT
jgi:peptidylprolyl isomerase